MSGERLCGKDLEFHPLTPERWDDFEELFSQRGAPNSCWCMWWRITREQFGKQLGEGNRQAMKAIVDAGKVPGILAYHDGKAVGWCSVGPREDFGSLERSPKLKRIDDAPVWSIVCFYIPKRYRRSGLMGLLLAAAVDHARVNGAGIVEAYPVEMPGDMSGSAGYMGLIPAFSKAGFEEVARPKERQSIMRRYVR
ncbi:MAG: GNAT family N-acetyltransferase [Actinomycetota bacterium]|nr:GNAT family N-acetyltransferase [Actinomycetota bacterium]MDD5668181.1 GNAT family N-acetyltransferase [Actinomycetota bacterium]